MCFSLTYVRPQTHPSRSRDPRPSHPSARPRPLRKSNFQLSGAPRPLRGHATRFSGGISQERRRVPLVCGALWRSHWTQFRQVTTRRYSTAHDPKTHNTCTTTRHICARSVHRTPQTLSQLNAQRSARAAVSSENTHGSPTDPLITQVTEVQNAVDAAVELALAGIARLARTVPKQLLTPSGQTCSSWAPCPCGSRRASPRRTRRR